MKHDKLFKKKNVVAVWTGTKKVDGKDTGKKAVVVGVTKKEPLANLKSEDVVPVDIQGVETDVIEVGEIKALAADRTNKFRPAPGGVSIGHYAITAGTLGCVVKKDNVRVILSNNHVLANSNNAKIGDSIYQPGPYDGGTALDKMATLSAFVPIKFEGNSDGCNPVSKVIGLAKKLFAKVTGKAFVESNKVDCALAKPLVNADVLDNLLELCLPIGYGATDIGQTDRKSGRTTAVTEGVVIGTDATVSVGYGDNLVAVFEDQLIYGPMSQGGDSGSVLLSQSNRIVGLLFAGSDTITIANKIGMSLRP